MNLFPQINAFGQESSQLLSIISLSIGVSYLEKVTTILKLFEKNCSDFFFKMWILGILFLKVFFKLFKIKKKQQVVVGSVKFGSKLPNTLRLLMSHY